MLESIKRRDALKTMAAASGLLMLGCASNAALPTKTEELPGAWFSWNEPCAIFQQGAILLVVDQTGALGTAVWTSPDSFVMLQGNSLAAGVTGTVAKNGRAINWSDNTVWTLDPSPAKAPDLTGGWLSYGRTQHCAIFQEGLILLVINEQGLLATALWTNPDSFVILGGGNWQPGLTGHVSNSKNEISWSNNTVWNRS